MTSPPLQCNDVILSDSMHCVVGEVCD